MTSPTGVRIKYAARLDFPPSAKSTNNTTEYEALLLALRKMKALGQQAFIVKTDSKVIRDQIEKESEAKEPELAKYLEAVRSMEKHSRGITVQNIPRNENDDADKIAKAAAQKDHIPPDVFYEVITSPSISCVATKSINAIQRFNWRTDIIAFIRGHFEPQDEAQLTRLKQRSRGYALIEGQLYKAGISTPWLHYVDYETGKDLLNEIHSGFCGTHIGSRALAGKAIRQGFYWPSAIQDAHNFVQ